MPGWSIGIPAKECKTGGKLQKVPGSVCLTVTRSKVVMFLRLFRMHSIEGWQPSRAAMGRSNGNLIKFKKPDVFRWHDSGDVQDLDHLKKFMKYAAHTFKASLDANT